MSKAGKDASGSPSKNLNNSPGSENDPSEKKELTPAPEKPKRINAFKEMTFGPQDLLHEDVAWSLEKVENSEKKHPDTLLSANQKAVKEQIVYQVETPQFQFNGKRGLKSDGGKLSLLSQNEIVKDCSNKNLDEVASEENENTRFSDEKKGESQITSPSQGPSKDTNSSIGNKGKFILERMPEYTDPSIPKGPTPPSPIEFKQGPPVEPAPKNRYTTGCWSTYAHKEGPPFPGAITEDLENGPLGKRVLAVTADLEREGSKLMDYEWMYDAPWKLCAMPVFTDDSLPRGPTPPSPIEFIQKPPVTPASKNAHNTGPWETYAHGPAPPLPDDNVFGEIPADV